MKEYLLLTVCIVLGQLLFDNLGPLLQPFCMVLLGLLLPTLLLDVAELLEHLLCYPVSRSGLLFSCEGSIPLLDLFVDC